MRRNFKKIDYISDGRRRVKFYCSLRVSYFYLSHAPAVRRIMLLLAATAVAVVSFAQNLQKVNFMRLMCLGAVFYCWFHVSSSKYWAVVRASNDVLSTSTNSSLKLYPNAYTPDTC